MSRPRKPFGATHPGRLPATMIKVLAAEMSDPQRLRRGKQYAHDGSVTDIAIEPGVVTCEVQGSRSTPYVAQIEVTVGDGMPMRRDITAHCSCPDDDNWGDHACKHIVAAMFVLSNEFLIEPELLDVWRGREPGDATTSGADQPDEPIRERSDHSRGHLRLVHSVPGRTRSGDPTGEIQVVPDPVEPVVEPVDRLDALLHTPLEHPLPDVPALDRVDLVPPRRRELHDLVSDALRHVRVDWD